VIDSPTEIVVQAHAKVNLFLRVLSLREDGYHEIESLIAPISLADEVRLRPSETLTLSVGGTSGPLTEAPGGPDNLAVVAALALAEETGSHAGADISLEKRIPVAAGLGGGSADAAAVLVGLNRLWGCGLSSGDMAQVASRIGSDVPALIEPGAALVSGRGDILRTVDLPGYWWVIVPAGFRVRTPEAYRWWDADGLSPGPDPQEVVKAASSGDPQALAATMFNDLEAPVMKRHPDLAGVRDRLVGEGALASILCGSGPTVAGLARDERHAREIESAFEVAFAVSTLAG
jgi:4-diphosphocytidyl-2-C-methyl-D-erythritol kinase